MCTDERTAERTPSILEAPPASQGRLKNGHGLLVVINNLLRIRQFEDRHPTILFDLLQKEQHLPILMVDNLKESKHYISIIDLVDSRAAILKPL